MITCSTVRVPGFETDAREKVGNRITARDSVHLSCLRGKKCKEQFKLKLFNSPHHLILIPVSSTNKLKGGILPHIISETGILW